MGWPGLAAPPTLVLTVGIATWGLKHGAGVMRIQPSSERETSYVEVLDNKVSAAGLKKNFPIGAPTALEPDPSKKAAAAVTRAKSGVLAAAGTKDICVRFASPQVVVMIGQLTSSATMANTATAHAILGNRVRLGSADSSRVSE